jgi:amino acid adenylation domain-containing protein
MTPTELLSRLSQLNIMVRSDNGQLIVSGAKGALTPTLRAELSAYKAELLTFLSNRTISTREKEPPLQPVSRDGKLRLSFAQQRLWFLDQYEPDKSFYNIPFALRLSGPLDVPALERSINEIIRRHEALRTTFPMCEGEPVQYVNPPVEHPFSVIDLRDLSASEREDEANRLADEEARRHFDLARGPLFRRSLIRLAKDDHILLLTLHHIVSDGWSVGVLYRELSVLYGAFSRAAPSPLAELPIQYADFAVWQRQRLTGDTLESQLSYWKKQLEGIPGVLNLPADHPRPPVQSYRGARQSIELPRELMENLKALSRKEGVTLFMTLLAAFQTLLYRYVGQQDIVVGSPIANRNRTEIEGLIGFFVNMLVLRTNFEGNPTFRELLARVRKTALEAYDHQELPFEKLVEEIRPERSLTHSPLFQVMFVLQNTPAGSRELSGLVLNPVKLENNTAKFDLTLSIIEQSHGLRTSWEYSTDLFDDATIERMARHYRRLLEGIVANPDDSVFDLPILTGPEKHQLLVDWNDTRREYPRDRCIHQVFEAQVEKTPDAIAVVFENQHLTYAELNRQANQVARYLMKLGVGPEKLVGICVERSLEMIIGLLGILKAGGAYVPQDPCFPKERLAFIWKDSQISVLLSQKHLIEVLPPFNGTLVCLDRDWDEISKENDENPKDGTISENLAYVTYTSGSTGRPKGVQIPHCNVVNVLTHVRQVLGLTAQDAIPLMANICFDISVMEFLLPLVTGARLVVVSSQAVTDGTRIDELLSDSGVTILHATPATWRLLLQTRWESASKLTILSGGEALLSELAAELALKGSSMWNLYGPTETTIYSSGARCGHDLKQGIVPIGRPIANTQLYILDDHLQPVPIGVSGNLCIAGDGLARGYLNRADLTAQSFVPHPYSKHPGARLYKTGDLARYLPDGNIEFLGRLDHQVKIRGFRIELGEIEAVLSQHPAVRETVVVAREEVDNPKSAIQNLNSDKWLVAYVVSTCDAVVTSDELRAFLKEKLPDYMVPARFVFLDAMPLTSNGKLDRKALPEPDSGNCELVASFVAPRTVVEELIAEIWAEVLKLDKFGMHDNFFDRGGHSLKATQVISRVRETFRIDLPVRVLFEAPTVAEFASRVEQHFTDPSELEEISRYVAEIDSLPDEEIKRRLEKTED